MDTTKFNCMTIVQDLWPWFYVDPDYKVLLYNHNCMLALAIGVHYRCDQMLILAISLSNLAL